MNVRIGCSGFPVGRERYFRRFSAAEIRSTLTQIPRRATAERWRDDFPDDAEISLVVWQGVTHPCTNGNVERLRPKPDRSRMLRYGHFRDTVEVRNAWARFEEVADVVEPKFLVFKTPGTFYPGADHLRDMYRFFKGLRRRRAVWVWERQGGGWEDRLVRKVCADLGLNPCVDPMKEMPLCGGLNYFRLGGARGPRDRAFSDGDLKELAGRCGQKPSYVFFETKSMWRDARRFQAVTDPEAYRLAEHRPVRASARRGF